MPASDLCRFTVATPTTSADVAVPEDARICDVAPRLAEHSGDSELAGQVVVLQRLGEEPLAPDQTVRGSGVRDGETLLLRPKEEPVPAMLFDDLVDGVGGAVADGFERWSGATAHRWLLLMGATPLVVGLVHHVLQPVGDSPAIGAMIVASILWAVGLVAARALDDRLTALVFTTMACCYATLGAWTVGALASGAGADQGILSWPPEPEQALLTLGVLAGGGLMTNWILGEVWLPVAITAVTGVVGFVSVVPSTVWTVEWSVLGVTVAMILMVTGPQLPTVAYRLARLAPPDLAQEPADMQSEIVTPLVGTEVLARGRLADSFLTILTAATAIVAGAGLLLASYGSTLARYVAVLAILGYLLRTRLLRNVVQRLIVAAAVAAGAMALVAQIVYSLDDGWRLNVGSVLVVSTSLASVALCRLVLPARHSPLWGRAADVGETIVAVVSLPMVMWVNGAFSAARGLAG